ncbi:hypothetical protein Phum_PHUM164340 [Pediculus humanus corporis]|uniref:Uncharacterized protein n=1 Tax=Pediculus humanus subsp. corporis TaxID=121224 RepID=E0VFQ6_PEDHC|nr:uncharacterized protein Phum_PHUM164340 [Pediculus humanus corporis]EEB12212.1 hypothetical protein Phum_PHUM164340 [Pediculus humanus corporis]
MDGGERGDAFTKGDIYNSLLKVLGAMSDCIGTRRRPCVRQPGNCPSVALLPINVGDLIISKF